MAHYTLDSVRSDYESQNMYFRYHFPNMTDKIFEIKYRSNDDDISILQLQVPSEDYLVSHDFLVYLYRNYYFMLDLKNILKQHKNLKTADKICAQKRAERFTVKMHETDAGAPAAEMDDGERADETDGDEPDPDMTKHMTSPFIVSVNV